MFCQRTFLACTFCFPTSDHVMFSWEFSFCLFISYAYICTCIRLFPRVASRGVKWKNKNVQARKVPLKKLLKIVFQCNNYFSPGSQGWGESRLSVSVAYLITVKKTKDTSDSLSGKDQEQTRKKLEFEIVGLTVRCLKLKSTSFKLQFL